MKTAILPIPTLGEIFQGQIENSVANVREIIVAIKDSIKESFVKTYSVCWDNNTSLNRREDIVQEPLQQKPETEEDKEIEKLEKEIQKLKKRKKIKEQLEKEMGELERLKTCMKEKEDRIHKLQQEFDMI